MRERPILFSAPMVRAILDGRKTQTRRIVRPQLDLGHYLYWQEMPPLDGKTRFRRVGADYPDTEKDDGIVCPYGQPGDRLWVREAWRVGKGYDEAPGSAFTSPTVWYEADGDLPLDRVGRYRHARFMPRWASRITLEVTGVRVERLQAISEADAFAEGCFSTGTIGRDYQSCGENFADLWESINGADSWDLNPWVWVVQFRRIVQEAKAA